MALGFNSKCNDSLTLSCIKIDFGFCSDSNNSSDSNIANGVAPALIEYLDKKEIYPFNISKRLYCCNNSQYLLPVYDNTYANLQAMVKHIDFEPNKKQLMLIVGQALLRHGYFLNKCALPKTIYIYNIYECKDNIKDIFKKEADKYFKLLPIPVYIGGKYALSEEEIIKLNKITNILFKISLNAAIFNLFDVFKVFTCKGPENAFVLLYEALQKMQKTAEYKPSEKFMNDLNLISTEYLKAEKIFKNIKKNNKNFNKMRYLKTMEFFLLLSENFGYQIPQNFKDNFKNKINLLVNTIKSVLSSYSHIKLEDELSSINANAHKEINRIAKEICSAQADETAEYSDETFNANWSCNFITADESIIGYNCNFADNVYKDSDSCIDQYRVESLCKRLWPLILNEDNTKYALFINNAIKDPDFPLYECQKEGYDDYYYLEKDHYHISPEDSLCYMNLAKIFQQIINSPYPYEFTKQQLTVKLPEIMPYISTAFCDCNILLK